MVDYTKCALDIIETLGVSNIKKVKHCITRLRIETIDHSNINDADINAINGVKGCFFSRGQCQIILGSGTTKKVYDKIVSLLEVKKTVDTSTGHQIIVNDEFEVIIKCDVGVVYSPCKGRIIPQMDINDETFSSGILGKGVGILPDHSTSSNCVFAPFHGYVTNIADGRHAIGLCSSEGMELLIHVGVDTVQMLGEGFVPLVREGDEIQLGDPILYFDINKIKKEGFDTTIVVLLTNSEDYSSVKCVPGSYNDEKFTERKKATKTEVRNKMGKYPGMRRCSFCNRTIDMVNRLISGPEGINICDECVYICVDILEEDCEKDEKQSPHKEKEPSTSKKEEEKAQRETTIPKILDEIIDKSAEFFEENYPNSKPVTSKKHKMDQDNFDDLVKNILNSF